MTDANERLWHLLHRTWDLGLDPFDDPDVVALLERHPELLDEVVGARASIHQLDRDPVEAAEMAPPADPFRSRPWSHRWKAAGAAAAAVLAVWFWWPQGASSAVDDDPRREPPAVPATFGAPEVVVHSLHVEWRRSDDENLVSYRRERGVVEERRATAAGTVSRTTHRSADLEDEE